MLLYHHAHQCCGEEQGEEGGRVRRREGEGLGGRGGLNVAGFGRLYVQEEGPL